MAQLHECAHREEEVAKHWRSPSEYTFSGSALQPNRNSTFGGREADLTYDPSCDVLPLTVSVDLCPT